MMPRVEWSFDAGGSISNGVTLPHDTWFAFYDDELVGYIERLPLSILECTDWTLNWYCGDGIASGGVQLGVQLSLEQVKERWVWVFAEGLDVVEAEAKARG